MVDKLRKIGFTNLFLLAAILVSVCFAIRGSYQNNPQEVVVHIQLSVIEFLGLISKLIVDRKYKDEED